MELSEQVLHNFKDSKTKAFDHYALTTKQKLKCLIF